jgi:hypothetical protein
MKAINSQGQVINLPDPSQEQVAAAQAKAAALVASRPMWIDAVTFLGRVTLDEYTLIRQAAAAQLESGNGQLELWIDNVRAAGKVDVHGVATKTAKAALVNAGLLTQQRADVIFADAS